MAVGVSSAAVPIRLRRTLSAMALRGWPRRLLVPGLIVLSAAVPTAHAAGAALMVDPTRPPAQMMALQAAAGGAAMLAVPRLQSVMIGPSGRSAIIDGQRYKVGDSIGDARLLKIAENEVVLSGAGGYQTMTLFTPVRQPVKQAPQTPRASAARAP